MTMQTLTCVDITTTRAPAQVADLWLQLSGDAQLPEFSPRGSPTLPTPHQACVIFPLPLHLFYEDLVKMTMQTLTCVNITITPAPTQVAEAVVAAVKEGVQLLRSPLGALPPQPQHTSLPPQLCSEVLLTSECKR